MADSTTIGPYVVGEIPVPLEYTFLDSDGVAINLTGYTAKFITRPADSDTAATFNATVSAPLTGTVTYTWTGAEIVSPGKHLAELWVGNTSNRFASVRLEYSVRASVGPVPAI